MFFCFEKNALNICNCDNSATNRNLFLFFNLIDRNVIFCWHVFEIIIYFFQQNIHKNKIKPNNIFSFDIFFFIERYWSSDSQITRHCTHFFFKKNSSSLFIKFTKAIFFYTKSAQCKKVVNEAF